MYKIAFGLFLLVFCFNTSIAQTKVDPNFHIYLLMGQSNMAGRGEITAEFKDEGHPNLFMLTADGKWVIAKHPVHYDKPKVSGVGPGLAFGIDMAKADLTVKIGLVPCAVGGTAIERWQPGAFDEATKTHPYDDALLRIREAMKYGVVKGVIWHQGESNSTEEKASLYLQELDTLIKRIRTEVGNPKLPVVVGELGRYRENYKYINEVIAKVPNTIPFTAVATSEDLIHKGDQTHFDSASATILGHRFAAKMMTLLKK